MAENTGNDTVNDDDLVDEALDLADGGEAYRRFVCGVPFCKIG